MSTLTKSAETGSGNLPSKEIDRRMKWLNLGLLGFVLLAFSWPSDHPVALTVLTLFTAYCFFCWTSCFHETAHQTLPPGTAPENIRLGRVLGMMMYTSYTVYRETHIRHHAYLNTPDDWELWPYTDPHRSKTFRRVFVWFDLFFGIFTAPYIYSRIWWHQDSPLKPGNRRTIRNEYLVTLGFWTAVLSLVAWFGLWLDFLRVWITPTLLAGFIQTGRKLTEHLGMASFDPLLGTRTVIGDSLLTRLSTFFNFNIFVHGPHHRYPRLSHEKLSCKMQESVEQNPGVEYPVYGSYWRAVRAMLPSLFKEPGCGVNVGGETLRNRKDVQDFVEDVSTEILADADQASALKRA